MLAPRTTRLPRRSRALAASLALLLGSALPGAAADGTKTPGRDADAGPDARARAGAAYEAGDCPAVLAALGEHAAAGGTLDGIDEYRRGFCLARTRQEGAAQAYEASAARLEAAASAEGPVPLDVHFYRVNALLNLQRGEDARAAAQAAVARWKAGTLLVTQDEPAAWFRLGKLFRDAGETAGALGPFRRALDAADASGSALRSAYLQRIARAAREAGDAALATRAAEMDAAAGTAGPEARYRAGLALITKGELEKASEALSVLRRLGGTIAMKAQYASQSVQRALEVKKWEREPVATLPDGRAAAALETGELQAELFGLAREIAVVLAEGEYEARPKKGGTGVFLKPTPEVLERLRDLQARFAGLLLESAQRDAPLREWAVSGGYANMIHKRLPRLFRDQATARFEQAGETPLPAD